MPDFIRKHELDMGDRFRQSAQIVLHRRQGRQAIPGPTSAPRYMRFDAAIVMQRKTIIAMQPAFLGKNPEQASKGVAARDQDDASNDKVREMSVLQ